MLICIIFIYGCNSGRKDIKEEQIRVESDSTIEADTNFNSVQGNLAWNQVATTPNSVILTGMADHRLVTIYKVKPPEKNNNAVHKFSSYRETYYEETYNEEVHFMPGIDVLYGYNLMNIAHYDLKLEKLNFLFEHPALIKTLYYPCYEQDSLDNKPINRDYFMVTVYDEDTNQDTIINRKDLRRMYYFDSSCTIKKALIPANYSVVRSQYDPKNDVMFIFARHDANKNGTIDENEPMQIFWIRLKAAAPAILMY